MEHAPTNRTERGIGRAKEKGMGAHFGANLLVDIVPDLFFVLQVTPAGTRTTAGV